MSRFSKSEAEARGWQFVHSAEADEVLTSGTQGEFRRTPETHVAEKYFTDPNGIGSAQIIHEEGETIGKLLERIAWQEARFDALQVDREPVELVRNPLNVDAAGLPLRTVSIPVDPEDTSIDKPVVQISEEEWAARDRSDVLVIRDPETGEQKQVIYGGSTAEATEAYDLKLRHDAAVEMARTELPDVEGEALELDPSHLIDSPGATGTGSLIVLKGEESLAEVQARKQEQKNDLENLRVVTQSVVGPQGVAPEGEEDLVGADTQVATGATDLESEQPRMTQDEFEAQKDALENPQDVVEPGATQEAAEEARDAQADAEEDAAKEARDEDLATADDEEHVTEVREAGLEAREEVEGHELGRDEEGGTFEGEAPKVTPAAEARASERGVDLSEVEGTGKDGTVTKSDVEGHVVATPAAKAAAEEKGVDLSEVEGTGKEGKVTKPDVEKAAE